MTFNALLDKIVSRRTVVLIMKWTAAAEVILRCLIVTFNRCFDWRDNETLWRKTINECSGCLKV